MDKVDTKLLIHVGVEFAVISGITIYFQKKVSTLNTEIDYLKKEVEALRYQNAQFSDSMTKINYYFNSLAQSSPQAAYAPNNQTAYTPNNQAAYAPNNQVTEQVYTPEQIQAPAPPPAPVQTVSRPRPRAPAPAPAPVPAPTPTPAPAPAPFVLVSASESELDSAINTELSELCNEEQCDLPESS
jgi:hypothetical protein